MKETKLPEGCKDNSVEASQAGSFSLPDRPQSLREDNSKESIKKQFSFNRGSFSGPLETDEEKVSLEESEAKAQEDSNAAAKA